MNHEDHVYLLQKGVPKSNGVDAVRVWADLGAGRGAFTLALAELLGAQAQIYAVDKDRRALQANIHRLQVRFAAVTVHTHVANFKHALDLPPLDGVVMANALHFVRHKDAVVQHIRRALRPGGRLLLVEYNVDRGNLWVPHPLSYNTWTKLAQRNGFAHVEQLATRPSSFLREFYSAVCW